MAGPPLVRASHLQEDLRSLPRLGEDAAARVRARVPEAIRTIEATSRVGWLPVELNADLADAVRAEAGEGGLRAWARASLLLSLEGLFKSTLQAILTLFDPTPATLLKQVPRAWPAVYRDAGTLEVTTPGPASARVVAHDLPPPLLREAFLLALCGTFEAAFEFSKVEGSVALEPRAHGAPPSYLVTWRPRA